MRQRVAQCLLPLLMLSLGACSSSLGRWENPPGQYTSSPGKVSAAPRSDSTTHTVQSGDTLYSIAFRHQLDYHDLANWNGIGSDYRIIPGRVLRLKPRAEVPVARPKPVPLPAPMSRPKPVPVPAQVATKPAPAPKVEAPRDVVVAAPEPQVATPAPAISAPTPSSAPTAPSTAANGGFEWLWPTTGTILKTYAPQQGFKGLDFGGNFGQPVVAAAPGRVVYSGNALKGYGELIIIKHNDTYLSAYSYNRHRNVSEGDVVTAGQPIGELGNGPENKPFLHFEIREKGQPVDPMRFLPKRETTPGAR